MIIKLIWTCFLTLSIVAIKGQELWSPKSDNPVELGDVDWYRDYNTAISQAQNSDKDLLILFQEVPGCSTCTTYGNEVMSHPLIVEAIEEHFIPLCIYNNHKGEDAKILKKFGEPSWNNPVVRIVNNSGKDIIPRLARSYSRAYLVEGIIAALRDQGKPTPQYLSNLQIEFSNHNPEDLILGMYCFWSGEKALAQIQGVTETQAGFMTGKEVVKVRFNPEMISASELVKEAKKNNCADVVFDDYKKIAGVPVQKKGKYSRDKESKYYLYRSPYKVIPMTPYQQLKVNAEISTGGDPSYLLSNRQLQLFNKVHQSNIKINNIEKEIRSAWLEVIEKLD